MVKFKDHFSKQSGHYSSYRPEYPEKLFLYLRDLRENHNLAWDCATGSGQAARGLASFFEWVHATDASEQQINHATGQSNVDFSIADAASSGLESGSVDLITVAQALHWFDLDEFYKEVKRVLKPNGIIAVWCYGPLSVNADVDSLYYDFYNRKVGSYWPPERAAVENGYKDLLFPFEKIDTPEFKMEIEWSRATFLGYLRSWSATAKYKNANNQDPVDEFESRISEIWSSEESLKVRWPLTLKVGKCKK